ncbi:MAG: hypothetical protein ACREQW_20765 [Candidatus Binatia bacterium]
MHRTKKLETTLGNLIVALTEEATTLLRDPKVACRWASYALTDLMRKKQVRFKNRRIWTRTPIMRRAGSLLPSRTA